MACSPRTVAGNFNPLLADVRLWIFNGLVRFDPDLKPIPDLAESWEISEDGLVYTFHLYKGVKFHDGVEMTADDVVYTAQLTLDEKVNSLWRSKFIVGGEPVKWEKVDDYTVRAILAEPSASFLFKCSAASNTATRILPKHILETCDDMATCDFNEHPIGTGPFKFVECVPDQRVVVEAFDDHFQGKPGLNRVVRLTYPNEQSALAALKSGELDVASLQEAGNVKVAEQDPNIDVYHYDSNWVMMARFNLVNPILKDVRVRQAISYAVDRLSLARAVIGPSVIVADSPIAVGWAANPNVRRYDYDPEKAKALLDEAGWEPGTDGIRVRDGQPLSLSVKVYEGEGKPELSAGMQQYLKAVGIDLQIRQLESAVYNAEVYENKDFDIYFDFTGSGIDPDIASFWMTPTEGEDIMVYFSNTSGYSNPEVDAAFKAAGVAASTEERQQHLWKAQELMTEDCVALWFHLWQGQMAVSKTIEGLSLPPSTADMNNSAVFREPWNLTSTRQ
jgi:peptide/nickel transport system substrate-binding protein